MERRNYLRQVASVVNLHGEAVPGQTLVEIMGNQRVLIEGHLGVLAYDHNLIRVKGKNGHIRICGEKLVLTQMTKSTLVIYGRIMSVVVCDECG